MNENLHVAIRHDIVYSGGKLKNKMYEILNLFNYIYLNYYVKDRRNVEKKIPTFCWIDNYCNYDWSTEEPNYEFSLSKDQLEYIIKVIPLIKNELFTALDQTKEELITDLQLFLDKGACVNGIYYFSWH